MPLARSCAPNRRDDSEKDRPKSVLRQASDVFRTEGKFRIPFHRLRHFAMWRTQPGGNADLELPGDLIYLGEFGPDPPNAASSHYSGLIPLRDFIAMSSGRGSLLLLGHAVNKGRGRLPYGELIPYGMIPVIDLAGR